MNVLYLARHGQNNNDDEGAISWSLRSLGHKVTEIHENSSFDEIAPYLGSNDVCLLHKPPLGLLHDLSSEIRCAFWYFDPVGKGFAFNDNYTKSLVDITQSNSDEHVYFFTDGDFVRSSKNDAFIHLPQGFDSREIKPVTEEAESSDVLFLGTWRNLPGYQIRREHLVYLSNNVPQYDDRHGLTTFKEDLTDTCQKTAIMLGMPPVTDSYWSNRVYILGGRGAFLLHPYSLGLQQSIPCLEMFEDKESLHGKILYFLDNSKERFEIRQRVQSEIVKNHKYIDRCITIIKELGDEKTDS